MRSALGSSVSFPWSRTGLASLLCQPPGDPHRHTGFDALTSGLSGSPSSVLSTGHSCMLSCFSRVPFYVTPLTSAPQAPLSLGFFRQEHWSGLPWSPPGDLPDPGIELESLLSSALAGRFLTTSATWEAPINWTLLSKCRGRTALA